MLSTEIAVHICFSHEFALTLQGKHGGMFAFIKRHMLGKILAVLFSPLYVLASVPE